MRPLRVKLNISEAGDHKPAREAFEKISTIHDDQAIFQINQTQYIDQDTWGFKITYRTQSEFIQTVCLGDIERVMWRVAPNSFDRKITSK
ncbi:hypothetical protein [Haloquadratum walsbyi]|jgi:hypothetical protein|uniref:Uncharacterized protein n=1 Tax=Haloquadratum walsbyi J07HQW2 TaxID=1238425 RepID=U1NJJ6_9EURY|nr:hypothetical protein [Haloquadratum walsbyi]ERG97123.1 MAG: hypothetical protein J07HQW2_03609 [Haloquadratum walsbyi J07HQW2]